MFALPDVAALGLVVMGSCPGGTTSNLFAHLARADLALSVAMTAASKALGVVLMPLCLYLYARPFTSATMSIPYGDVVKALLVLLVPVAIAMALRRRYGPGFARVAERVGSISGLTVLLALVGISLTRNASLFRTISPSMYAAAGLLGAFGMLAGAAMARLAGLSRSEQRTVAFETGVQNSPLCFAILAATFPGPGQLELLKLPLLYALFVLLEASLITLVYRSRDSRRAVASDSRFALFGRRFRRFSAVSRLSSSVRPSGRTCGRAREPTKNRRFGTPKRAKRESDGALATEPALSGSAGPH